MKKIIVLPLFLLLLTGCAAASVPEATVVPTYEPTQATAATKATEPSFPEGSDVYADVLMPSAYLIIGESNVEYKMLLGGMESATSIPLANIAQVKHTTLPGYATVQIFAQNGDCITAQVLPEQVGEILDSLKAP